MTADNPRIAQIRDQLQIYQAIAQSDYSVPPRQAFPVASRPDIAFRPSCYQLEPVWEPTQTAWVWEDEILYRTPGSSLATEDVLTELAASGVCLIGSNIRKIPIVPTDEVFTKFQAAVTATQVVEETQPMAPTNAQRWSQQWDLIIWLALPLLAISAVLVALSRRSPD
ncbi:hypothetical protein [Halomicronema sp. CCY15110]|uniref:hypothetical protein n=1 Tax=Halomicronema sp. CCY15110 TaxID=2767773 RepID=UPI001950EE3D|nr:hypothetical protein [Halomicronema sp. CCY15110]